MSTSEVMAPRWALQLAKDHEQIAYQYGVRLKPPTIEVRRLGGRHGQWNPATRTITIGIELIETYPWDIVLEVLKHEMAHQLVDEVMGGGRTAHDAAFEVACDRLAVADWARSATGSLPETIPDWHSQDRTSEEARLLARVDKLLSLAASTNEHEAALAMERVRELHARYNLDRLARAEAGKILHAVVRTGKERVEAFESRIISLLCEFYGVKAIAYDLYDARRDRSEKVFELLGTRESLQMAEYVHAFLKRTVLSLWTAYRKDHPDANRRSYTLGVLEGFARKLRKTPPAERPQEKALVKAEDRRLADAFAKRYPKTVSRSHARGSLERSAYSAGIAAGGKVVVHHPVGGSRPSFGGLLA